MIMILTQGAVSCLQGLVSLFSEFCVCVCGRHVYLYAGVNVCKCMCVEVRSQYWMSSLVALHLAQALLLNLELTDAGRLDS